MIITSVWRDAKTALSFLTTVPVGYADSAQPGRAFAYFPLVGGLIGGVLAALAWALPFSAAVNAVLVLAAWVIITGGLHLDGLGDSCDGLLASVPVARRLEIMKDPQTGSWAVIGLILVLLGKWASLMQMSIPALLVLPPVAGRWGMVLQASAFAYARESGLGGYFRQGLGRVQVIIATVTALVLFVAFGGWIAGLAVAAVTLVMAFGLGRWAAGRLGGGLTGDVYGATCELIEWGCLLMLGAVSI